MDNTQKFRIGLRSIQEISYHCADDNVLSSGIDIDKLQYKYYTETVISPQENSISVKAILHYFSSENDYAKLEVLLNFFADRLNEIISYNKDTREISLNPDIIPTFLNITCGTVRGIFAEKTKGNNLSNYPVPLINPAALTSNNRIVIK